MRLSAQFERGLHLAWITRVAAQIVPLLSRGEGRFVMTGSDEAKRLGGTIPSANGTVSYTLTFQTPKEAHLLGVVADCLVDLVDETLRAALVAQLRRLVPTVGEPTVETIQTQLSAPSRTGSGTFAMVVEITATVTSEGVNDYLRDLLAAMEVRLAYMPDVLRHLVEHHPEGDITTCDYLAGVRPSSASVVVQIVPSWLMPGGGVSF